MKRSIAIRLALALGVPGAWALPVRQRAPWQRANPSPLPGKADGDGSVLGASRQVTVPKRAVVVSGTVAHFVPVSGCSWSRALTGTCSCAGRLGVAHRAGRGHFETTVLAPRAGHVRVALAHVRNTKMLSFMAVDFLHGARQQGRPGATGRFVQLVQQQLAALHLFIPQTGVFDQGTELALDTYHRLLGKGRGPHHARPRDADGFS